MARKGPRPIPAIERFWPKVYKTTANDCWIWLAHIRSDGYGSFAISPGFQITAHRAAYMLLVGEVPNGLLVCHTCDNRKCVNPGHLFLGTHKDNTEDMINKGRNNSPGAPGEKNHFSILTEDQVVKIKSMLGEYSHSQLAQIFGVSKSAITAISTGQTWRHLE